MNRSEDVTGLAAPSERTVTSTVPVPGGAVAVHDVAVPQAYPVANCPPKWTTELETKPLPVIVTRVPPFGEPSEGLIPVTVGPVCAPASGVPGVNCPSNSPADAPIDANNRRMNRPDPASATFKSAP